MPRFFFDVQGARASPEAELDDGLEMPDADVACREAFIAAAAMLRDAALHGGSSVALEVRDEAGQRACRVTAHIRVARN